MSRVVPGRRSADAELSGLTAAGVVGAFLSGSLPGRQARPGGRREAAADDGAAVRGRRVASSRVGRLARAGLGVLRELHARS